MMRKKDAYSISTKRDLDLFKLSLLTYTSPKTWSKSFNLNLAIKLNSSRKSNKEGEIPMFVSSQKFAVNL